MAWLPLKIGVVDREHAGKVDQAAAPCLAEDGVGVKAADVVALVPALGQVVGKRAVGDGQRAGIGDGAAQSLTAEQRGGVVGPVGPDSLVAGERAVADGQRWRGEVFVLARADGAAVGGAAERLDCR